MPIRDTKTRMLFVDGSNVLGRLPDRLGCKKVKKHEPLELLKVGLEVLNVYIGNMNRFGQTQRRCYWFGSYTGSQEHRDAQRDLIRKFGFDPVLFPRRDGREKGVDIALTKTMLVQAFNRTIDHATLVAGDEDFVELVDEVKRYGCIVDVAFFPSFGLSEELRRQADGFTDLLPDQFLPEESRRHGNWRTRLDDVGTPHAKKEAPTDAAADGSVEPPPA